MFSCIMFPILFETRHHLLVRDLFPQIRLCSRRGANFEPLVSTFVFLVRIYPSCPTDTRHIGFLSSITAYMSTDKSRTAYTVPWIPSQSTIVRDNQSEQESGRYPSRSSRMTSKPACCLWWSFHRRGGERGTSTPGKERRKFADDDDGGVQSPFGAEESRWQRRHAQRHAVSERTRAVASLLLSSASAKEQLLDKFIVNCDDGFHAAWNTCAESLGKHRAILAIRSVHTLQILSHISFCSLLSCETAFYCTERQV